MRKKIKKQETPSSRLSATDKGEIVHRQHMAIKYVELADFYLNSSVDILLRANLTKEQKTFIQSLRDALDYLSHATEILDTHTL